MTQYKRWIKSIIGIGISRKTKSTSFTCAINSDHSILWFTRIPGGCKIRYPNIQVGLHLPFLVRNDCILCKSHPDLMPTFVPAPYLTFADNLHSPGL
jgi:hypothetical protein